MRMIERRQHVCLALEAREPIGIRRKRIGKHFEGHVKTEAYADVQGHQPFRARNCDGKTEADYARSTPSGGGRR